MIPAHPNATKTKMKDRIKNFFTKSPFTSHIEKIASSGSCFRTARYDNFRSHDQPAVESFGFRSSRPIGFERWLARQYATPMSKCCPRTNSVATRLDLFA
jgi:hypothetical protein